MTIDDFKNLPRDGTMFEALVCALLESMGYRILEKPAVGTDGGRDILLERRLRDHLADRTERVIVQCKHFAHSGIAVADGNVGVWQNAMTRFHATGYLLVTDTKVTENLSRSLREFTNNPANFPKWADYWDAAKLLLHLHDHPHVARALVAFSRKELIQPNVLLPIILIIDDRPFGWVASIQEIESRFQNEYQILTFRDPSEGVRFVKTRSDHIRIILLDMMMPLPLGADRDEYADGMFTGLWVLRQVKSLIREKHIPVLVISGGLESAIVSRLDEYIHAMPPGLVTTVPKLEQSGSDLVILIEQYLKMRF